MKKMLILMIPLLLLTGCGNRNIFDTNYTYDYAECYLNGEYQKYGIKKWSDYDGEQIQIEATDGKLYLLSMNYCRLVRE